MKTVPTLIRHQPLPKLSPVFSANRRSLVREPAPVGLSAKKLNGRERA
jgi:hypothetical protein